MMKLRPTSALLGLLLLTAGVFRSEAADSAKPALALDGIFDVPGNIFNLGTNGQTTGFSWEYLLTPLDGSQSRSAVLRSLATYAEGGAYWSWEREDSAGEWSPAMELSADSSGHTTLKVNGQRVLTSADWDALTSALQQPRVQVIRLDGGAAIGAGLTSSAPAQVVVGRHNDTTTDPNPLFDKTKGLFIVGAGSGVVGGAGDIPEKRNALRVLEDGTVLVQPRGDLHMGDFTAGPQP